MRERKVILTWEAIYDITDIADYIEHDFGKKHADKFQKDIQRQIEDIGYMGGILGKTHIYYRSYSIFKKSFPPSIIFYVVKRKLVYLNYSPHSPQTEEFILLRTHKTRVVSS